MTDESTWSTGLTYMTDESTWSTDLTYRTGESTWSTGLWSNIQDRGVYLVHDCGQMLGAGEGLEELYAEQGGHRVGQHLLDGAR